ncbi:MAG TPA: TetR family transcriptional regulator [Paraburkholderia sp.]|uniref:TetR/AcrR family transcriptional regulator n=1 Tax=Paraburkholderia sp. TaxID=1926495 RepID=UPI002B4A2C3B|nr:TetR family transcriptional regulator [Paraburkholderia sp.]HKR42573.1 TetR family transcriptional regulator [Paraburkholderia sp.]
MEVKARAHAMRVQAHLTEVALQCLLECGITDTTLEDVAVRAGLAQGAVSAHFSDKSALISAAIEGLRWPLDIGEKLSHYRGHRQPLRLLYDRLCIQISRCIDTPGQWRRMTLVFSQCGYTEWPSIAIDRVLYLQESAIANLVHVLKFAKSRRQLRADIDVDSAARCLNALMTGVLSQNIGKPIDGIRINIRECLLNFLKCIEQKTEYQSNIVGNVHRTSRAKPTIVDWTYTSEG